MASVFDVAAYILHRAGTMTAMKLQKLVFYSQAWSLVWDETPLFAERIEAWANGPVVPDLFDAHKGQFTVTDQPTGNRDKLTLTEQKTVNAVLKFYGKKTAPWLSDLTHREAPWKEAREGVPDGERSNREITVAAMANYYGNL